MKSLSKKEKNMDKDLIKENADLKEAHASIGQEVTALTEKNAELELKVTALTSIEEAKNALEKEYNEFKASVEAKDAKIADLETKLTEANTSLDTIKATEETKSLKAAKIIATQGVGVSPVSVVDTAKVENKGTNVRKFHSRVHYSNPNSVLVLPKSEATQAEVAEQPTKKFRSRLSSRNPNAPAKVSAVA